MINNQEDKSITVLRALLAGSSIIIRGYQYRLVSDFFVVVDGDSMMESKMPLTYFIKLANELSDEEILRLAFETLSPSQGLTETSIT